MHRALSGAIGHLIGRSVQAALLAVRARARHQGRMQLSIIVPVLNEADRLAVFLERLAPLRQGGCEVIVVDGGSTDGSTASIGHLVDKLIASPRGRGVQMNAGAAAAHGEALLFLHADTSLPHEADRLVATAIRRGHPWGRFDARIEGRHPLLPVVAFTMNRRSCLTGIATGDQAIFVTRQAFAHVGGYRDIPLMEDIALSKALKRLGRPACLREKVVTSGRRFEQFGVLRTIVTMWRLRAAFALGADPAALARRYGYRPRDA